MGLVESGKMPKPLTSLLNTARKYSLWAYQWGLACCAIEMGAAFASPRYDVMRLGVTCEDLLELVDHHDRGDRVDALGQRAGRWSHQEPVGQGREQPRAQNGRFP